MEYQIRTYTWTKFNERLQPNAFTLNSEWIFTIDFSGMEPQILFDSQHAIEQDTTSYTSKKQPCKIMVLTEDYSSFVSWNLLWERMEQLKFYRLIEDPVTSGNL